MDDNKENIEAEVLESNENDEKNESTIKNNEKPEQEEKTETEMEGFKNPNAVTLIDKDEEKNETEVKEYDNDTNQEKTNTEQDIKEENQYQFKKVKTNKKSHKYAILVTIAIVILIAVAILSTIFALINSNNNKILNKISIRNILVEGLTEEEAIKMLQEKFEQEKNTEILLKINEETYAITPEQIEVQYNVEKAVEQAYKIGRDGNIFQNNFEILEAMIKENNIDIEITYNEELLTNILNEFNAKLPNAMIDNTYYIEEDELIIKRGTDGIVINSESAKQEILDAIKDGNIKEIELQTEYKECPEIDIEKIHEEVKTEPQNASYKTDPFEIIPHKNGIDFDVEEAKKTLSEEKEEYIITLIITEPETLTNEIGEEAFPDLLGSFSTKYDETNVTRSKNVKIALAELDGVVVMPGEVFSYNETLGERTVEKGYGYANGFAGGKVVPMLAGGICQVSSTLYDAVLYANLKIVERHNHMFQATYVEPGKDATVVYGSLDFKFENTRNYPIMIKTKSGGGLAEVKIFGIKEEVEYEVEIITTVLSYTPYNVVYQNDSSLAPGQERVSQWGLQGCKSVTYRIVKLNGQEVSRELLSEDTYAPLSKIVRRGVATQTIDTNTTPETETQNTETQNTETQNTETQNTETPETPETPTQTPETETSTQAPETTPTETPEEPVQR